MEETIREESNSECNKAAFYIKDISDFTRSKYEITFDDDYEVKVEDGIVIAVSKTIKLPKTFEECCNILGISQYLDLNYVISDGDIKPIYTTQLELLRSFRKLMICRDAYRQIAGWKPWENTYNGVRKMFGIMQSGSTVRFERCSYAGCMLMFPTEDMCKEFYENFKDLIFKCHDII